MKKLPENLLISLEGIEGFDWPAFEAVHQSGDQITSVRINPAKVSFENDEYLKVENNSPFSIINSQIPWSEFGYYLNKRPSFTFDPLFHAGCYYVQEASSMFLEQALMQLVNLKQPLKVLDLCAAPGGKSTHIQSLFSAESLLVSNEVIKNRAGILKSNIIKWGCNNVFITNNDPQHFTKLEGFFDVIVVDAPCSGSGLFRRDEEAINEWSEEAVLMCCGRQKRIIADVLPALKENGLLIYSTCSYSKEEDEDIADWLVLEMEMKNEKLKIENNWGIVESESMKTKSECYRFFPDKVKGEGFFLSCFRKTASANTSKFKAPKIEKASAKETEIIKPWLKLNGDVELIKSFNIHAIPAAFINDFAVIKHVLNIVYAGVALGEVMKDKLVPDHALALSTIISDNIHVQNLEKEQAIKYLQRSDVSVEVQTKGWQIVAYQHQNLGWINALPNRINNYYPKEFRILKQSDNTTFEK